MVRQGLNLCCSPVDVVDGEGLGEEYEGEHNTDGLPGAGVTVQDEVGFPT